MRVAILGCGPTGLMAAHACYLESVSFQIYSKKRKSELYGSQYLHEPIPEISDFADHVNVKYVVRGTPEEYRQKVHGKWWDGHVAPEDFESDHFAWDIREAYDRLWEKYEKNICQFSIPKWCGGLDRFISVREDINVRSFDLVISTVPRTLWQMHGEEFIFSEGWALGDAPDRGQKVPYACPDNTIICDGTEEVPWTRLSNVFGYTTIEWPHHAPKPNLQGVVKVIKPLHYKPDPLHPNKTEKWLHVGRYGKWEKGVVTTDAFNEVLQKLKEIK